jgi:hypothetical protein
MSKSTATDLQQEKEKALTAVVRKAIAAVKKNATVENLRLLKAAEEDLAACRASLSATPAERSFKNLREVAAYLTDERGYKVSERKVYDDKRQFRRQADGTYLASDVDDYASRFLPKKDGSDDNDNGLAAIKAQKENELLEEKIRRERRRNQVETGRLIQRSKVDHQLAARASFLLSDIEAFAHGKLPDIAEQVLDATTAPPEAAGYLAELKNRIGPELIDTFTRELRTWIDRYSQPLQFQAPMAADLDDIDDDNEDTEP